MTKLNPTLKSNYNSSIDSDITVKSLKINTSNIEKKSKSDRVSLTESSKAKSSIDGRNVVSDVRYDLVRKYREVLANGSYQVKSEELADKIVQKVKEIRIDDDQDCVWLSVDIGDGASCHVGYKSCFYRSIPLGKIDNARQIEMKFEEKEKKFDPDKVYKGQPSPTKV